jgi:glycosyltransferase involved in cell wall biosynthesis
MSMEKPIITCDMPGCREAVEEGKNGFLVLPKNVESLQNTMEKVFLMPFSEREVMGKFGRNKAITEFDHNISNRIYEEVIEKLI